MSEFDDALKRITEGVNEIEHTDGTEELAKGDEVMIDTPAAMAWLERAYGVDLAPGSLHSSSKVKMKGYIEWSEGKPGVVRSIERNGVDEPTAFIRFQQGTGAIRFPLTALIKTG